MSQNSQLSHELLEIGFHEYNGRLSDGTPSDNHLNIGFNILSLHPKILGKVVMGLCEIIEPYEVDFIAGIPNGATGLDTAVAMKLEKEVFPLHLTKKGDKFDFKTCVDRDCILTPSARGALIDDVYRTGKNFEKALLLDNMQEKIVVMAAIYDRGRPKQRKHIRLEPEVKSLVKRFIPTKLSPSSSLMDYLRLNSDIS